MTKTKTIQEILRANGAVWFSLYILERCFGKITPYFQRRRINYEISNTLPGFNTKYYNHKEWTNYNWNNGGEEWTVSEQWKKALIDRTIYKYFAPQKTILEIGPGAARWSVTLAKMAKHLTLLDLTEVSINLCKEKLKAYHNCQFIVGSGDNLALLPNQSIDYIWSYDVFVHIAPNDTESYIKEFARVMKTNGIAIIHHPAAGGHKGGFRSSTTNDFFLLALAKHNFTLIEQFEAWGDNDCYTLKAFNDIITVFRRQ